jgi:hypothetical protein
MQVQGTCWLPIGIEVANIALRWRNIVCEVGLVVLPFEQFWELRLLLLNELDVLLGDCTSGGRRYMCGIVIHRIQPELDVYLLNWLLVVLKEAPNVDWHDVY